MGNLSPFRPPAVPVPKSTSYAIISDPQNGRKYPLIADELIPDCAILDPNLVLSVPRQVAVDTGMDVLTTPLRRLVSTGPMILTTRSPEKAIALVWQHLPDVFSDENNIAAAWGKYMHNASVLPAWRLILAWGWDYYARYGARHRRDVAYPTRQSVTPCCCR